jgi:pimeloyl-ACP methyl ester carboxylesterase
MPLNLAHISLSVISSLTIQDAVVAENTFLSIPAMVDQVMPLVAPLKGLVLRMYHDNGALAPKIQQPVLLISGDADTLVPPEHMHELKARLTASADPQMMRVPGGTHNDTWEVAGMAWYDRLRDFVAQLLGERGAAYRQRQSETVRMGKGCEADADELLNCKLPSLPTMGRDFSVK